MENLSIFAKVIEFISKPMNLAIVTAAFLTSLTIYLLNFLPSDIIETLKIAGFLDNFSFIIFLIVIGTFFILLVQSIYFLGQKINQYFKIRRHRKYQKEIFEDEHCFKILEKLYEKHPDSVEYPLDNQCIQLLSQYGLIMRPSTTGYMTRTGRQIYSYILQPQTVKMIEEKLN